MTAEVAERTEITKGNGGTPAKPSPAAQFRRHAVNVAASLLTEWVGEERAREATGRISAALAASAASARNPADFYACTIQSIATCVAISALTGIMPGVGSTALAYVVPQRARKGEPPQLQYSLSHRGLNALARRCGQTMIAVPISKRDTIRVSEDDGEISIVERDIDNPPTTFEDLRGIVVIVKEISTGVVTCRNWVPKKLIEERRSKSRSFTGPNPEYSPWSTWPIEMAVKTAMHYSISRGWCVIDDTSAARAMTADVEQEFRLLPAPVLPDTAENASEAIADMLEGRDADSTPTAPDDPDEDSQEPAASVSEPTADIPPELMPHDGETADGWCTRIGNLMGEAADDDRLAQLRHVAARAAESGFLSDGQQAQLDLTFDVLSKELTGTAKKSKQGKLV